MSISSTSTVIDFKDVSVSFGIHQVLRNISFRVKMGEFVYIVGRTGSGKSTLLKLVYADCLPDSGEIIVDSHAIHTIRPDEIPYLRRKLGIVFQDFQLLPDRTVFENIRFALKATGWKNSTSIKHQISNVLLKVGLTAKTHTMPHQLSGGEQQRVTIARALINDPLVIVADEPTGNLDPEASAYILEILQKINRSGTAILMATHEYPIIRQFPSRIIEVDHQSLIEHPTPDTFFSRFLA